MTQYTQKSFSVPGPGICFDGCGCRLCRLKREEEEQKKKEEEKNENKDKRH